MAPGALWWFWKTLGVRTDHVPQNYFVPEIVANWMLMHHVISGTGSASLSLHSSLELPSRGGTGRVD